MFKLLTIKENKTKTSQIEIFAWISDLVNFEGNPQMETGKTTIASLENSCPTHCSSRITSGLFECCQINELRPTLNVSAQRTRSSLSMLGRQKTGERN